MAEPDEVVMPCGCKISEYCTVHKIVDFLTGEEVQNFLKNENFESDIDEVVPNEMMFNEARRIQSFVGWDVAWLSPFILAKAGFFYLQKLKAVKCPFCPLHLWSFNVEDDYEQLHKIFMPLCPFVINPATCGNIPFKAKTMVVRYVDANTKTNNIEQATSTTSTNN